MEVEHRSIGWRIYYADGATCEGRGVESWCAAPSTGIQVVIDFLTDYSPRPMRVVHAFADYYWWADGVVQSGNLGLRGIKSGLLIGNAEWERIRDRAYADETMPKRNEQVGTQDRKG